ncbi:MAG: zf-HC2 domain-containing protein [Chloroflexi bacterium]|nr:zf-HC2 domain-containing protein [Chloroflexota bacterium]
MRGGPFGWLRRLVGKDEFDCRDVLANCSDYVDEELSERDAQLFDAHLDDCPDCPPYVATFKATVMTMRDLEPKTAPPELRERIHERIAAESEHPS